MKLITDRIQFDRHTSHMHLLYNEIWYSYSTHIYINTALRKFVAIPNMHAYEYVLEILQIEIIQIKRREFYTFSIENEYFIIYDMSPGQKLCRTSFLHNNNNKWMYIFNCIRFPLASL